MINRPQAGLAVLAFAAVLIGCATASGTGQPTGEALPRVDETSSGIRYELGAGPAQRLDFAAPPDSVWSAVVSAYRALGIQANLIDEQSRAYGVRGFTGTQLAGRRVSDWVRCAEGAGPSAIVGRRTELAVVSTVRALPNGSSALETAVNGMARRVDGTSTPPVRCESNGELERRIAAAVRERLSP